MKELCFCKNSIKGHDVNQKVIKNPGYFSLMERIGDLHMIPDENIFNRKFKTVHLHVCLSGILYILLAILKFLKYFIKSKQFTSWATAFPNKEDSSKNSFN